MDTNTEKWRATTYAAIRISFGLVWAIDAAFKWQPSFISGFSSYLTGALAGQPVPVQVWIKFWIEIINVDPVLFAHIVAISETALAASLLFGIFTNVAYFGGTLLCFVIWSTAEGLGGPYTAGSTDIGTAVIYIFVFVLLYVSRAGLTLGVDGFLTPRLGRWAILAAGERRHEKQ